jgi:anti-sigma B factor antagonist
LKPGSTRTAKGVVGRLQQPSGTVKLSKGDQGWRSLLTTEECALIQDRPGTPLSSICSIRAERHLDTTIVRLYGEFDLSSEERFREEVETLLDGETATLVIDLRGLTFMDSTGMRALITLHNLAARDEFDYALLCDGGNVKRVLHETGLHTVLPIVDTSGAIPAPEPLD